jgi:hypothetical protein
VVHQRATGHAVGVLQTVDLAAVHERAAVPDQDPANAVLGPAHEALVEDGVAEADADPAGVAGSLDRAAVDDRVVVARPDPAPPALVDRDRALVDDPVAVAHRNAVALLRPDASPVGDDARVPAAHSVSAFGRYGPCVQDLTVVADADPAPGLGPDGPPVGDDARAAGPYADVIGLQVDPAAVDDRGSLPHVDRRTVLRLQRGAGLRRHRE